MKRIRLLLTSLVLLNALVSQAVVPQLALAACGSGNDAKNQVLNGIGGAANECDGSRVGTILQHVVEILSWVVGIVAVIMVVIAGFKYVTSGGDAQKAGSAKSTLVYALIGLLIAALAQFLVHFVINQAAAEPATASNAAHHTTP